ncbi:MAG: helix-turn-helix domain-containing protein [Phycisphaerales bacterium]
MTGADSAPHSEGDRVEVSESPLTGKPGRGNAGLPRLLTLTEVARVLRVHRNTVERERKEGRLQSVRVGRRVLVPLEALERYLDQPVDGENRCERIDYSSTEAAGSSAATMPAISTSVGVGRAHAASGAVLRARAILRKRNDP